MGDFFIVVKEGGAKRKGFAPLAARPAPMLLTSSFANGLFLVSIVVRQSILLSQNGSHPKIPFSKAETKQKRICQLTYSRREIFCCYATKRRRSTSCEEGIRMRVFRSSREPLSTSRVPANLSMCKQKRICRLTYPFLWRRERDLNPCIHSCITRFRIVRVRPLRHLCKQLLYYTASR